MSIIMKVSYMKSNNEQYGPIKNSTQLSIAVICDFYKT